MAMALPNMSNANNPSFQPQLNTKVFQPMLVENFDEIYNSFYIENPLTKADLLANMEDNDSSFLTNLNDIQKPLPLTTII
jgi:hypothetical protein